MKVLWVSRFIPFPMNAGDRIYSARLAIALARAGVDLTVLGLADAEPPAEAQGPKWLPIGAEERSSLAALLRPLPIIAERASPPAMVAAFRRLVEELAPRAVVVDYLASGWILSEIRRLADPPAVIYIAHNFEERLAVDIANGFSGSAMKKLLLKINATKVRKLEHALVDNGALVVALTERDRQDLVPRDPSKPALVLPPGFAGHRVQSRVIDAGVPRRVVMLGSVRWIAKQINVEEFVNAADEKFHKAGITFDVIGDVDDEFRQRLAPRMRATRLRGFVDDLPQELAQARLGLIIEAVGGGFKLKILDYLFARIPVAALAGSFEGLPPTANANIEIRPTASALADAVIRLIDDFDALNRMQNACFEAVKDEFDWDADGRKLAAAISAL